MLSRCGGSIRYIQCSRIIKLFTKGLYVNAFQAKLLVILEAYRWLGDDPSPKDNIVPTHGQAVINGLYSLFRLVERGVVSQRNIGEMIGCTDRLGGVLLMRKPRHIAVDYEGCTETRRIRPPHKLIGGATVQTNGNAYKITVISIWKNQKGDLKLELKRRNVGRVLQASRNVAGENATMRRLNH